ncbi:MAG: hypothetical protein AAF460_14620, partial [Pseudomonadota bacterium]
RRFVVRQQVVLGDVEVDVEQHEVHPVAVLSQQPIGLYAGIVLGIVAAVVHWYIDEDPLPRLATA